MADVAVDKAKLDNIVDAVNERAGTDGQMSLDAVPGAVRGIPKNEGTMDHSQLTNRNAKNQHPMSAITGLETALEGKQPVGSYEKQGLGMTGATVGQIARIKAVDASGKPTEWEPVDIPGGAAEPDWEQFAEITVTPENASNRYQWDIPLAQKAMLTTQHTGKGDKVHLGALVCTDKKGVQYPGTSVNFYDTTFSDAQTRSIMEVKNGVVEGIGYYGSGGGRSYATGLTPCGEIIKMTGFAKAFCKDNSGNMLPGTIIRLYIIRK